MTPLFRFLSLVFALSLAALAFTSAAGATRLYAPSYFPDQIAGFDVATDGGLTAIAGSQFPVGAFPAGNGQYGFAMTPDGTRGVSSFGFSGGVQGLNVAANGAITPAQSIVGSNKGGPPAVSPDGRFAYVPIGGATKGVDAYSIGTDGKLTQLSGAPFYNSESFGSLAISPDGKMLYGAGQNAVRPFTINADGSLVAKPAFPAPGVGFLGISPDGRFLFWTNEGTNSLNSFAIAPDGGLSTVGSPVVVGSTFNGFFSVAPNGRFMTWSDYNGDTLGGNVYSVNTIAINPDGSLAAIGAAPTGDIRCRTTVVSPGSTHVYCGGDGGKLVVAPLGANGVAGAFREVGSWTANEPEPFIFAPEFGGTASFKPRATTKPLTMIFDGSASTAPAGPIDNFAWSFGDGATASLATPNATHAFPKAGVYSVVLTASRVGCADKTIYTGQTTVCNGSPNARKTIEVDTPPWITSLKIAPSSLSRKSKITYKLTEKAKVTFVVQKSQAGRTVGKSCKKVTKSNRKLRKCTRWIAASKKFTSSGRAGKTNSIKFTGTVKRVKLRKGSYRLYALAKDSAKQLSPSATAKFRVRK